MITESHPAALLKVNVGELVEEEYLERMDQEYEALMASDDEYEYDEEQDYTTENDKYWERY